MLFKKLLYLSAIFFLFNHFTFSQGEKKIIQMSGVVVGADSISGVGGVHIYVPKAGRGTTSNPYGYFTKPVLEEDSLIISAVGYQKQNLIVPGDKGESISLIIELKPDTTILPELEIFPYPTGDNNCIY